MKIKAFVILLIILVIGCKEKENINESENNMNVAAEGGLRMRSEPSPEASTLITIPNKSTVIKIEETGEIQTISGKSGKWTKVKFNDAEGWVFGGFLIASSIVDDSPIREYFIKFEGQEDDMVTLKLNNDGNFSGTCYDGYSSEAKWKGKYIKLDEEKYNLKGEAYYYHVGPEGETKETFILDTNITIMKKGIKYGIFDISTDPIPGCSDISIKKGILKSNAYGTYAYWDNL